MKLTCEMRFDLDEITAAVKAMAERLMPTVPGYEVEVELAYYRSDAIARLVPIKVAEEITIEPVAE